jgi:GTP-binding protein
MNGLCPFLYPFSGTELRAAEKYVQRFIRSSKTLRSTRRITTASHTTSARVYSPDATKLGRLNPSPDDYSISPFVDKCVVTIQAGSGGNGCISFLREKYIPDGPANGGDGGFGGSIFIQTTKNCSSLNNISKTKEYLAGSGGHGQGGNMGGKRGKDILLEVPLGTVVREIKRWDPVEIQMNLERQARRSKDREEASQILSNKWLLYPGLTPRERAGFDRFPSLPRARRPALAAMEPLAPFRLDFDEPMDVPVVLAAGAIGGYGNPHFVSREIPRPKVATKGDPGLRVALSFELKLVADMGLVGLPNAGKSTLLRAMSNSRARIGSWAFTTLQPNIGTVVLDDYKGRSTNFQRTTQLNSHDQRTRFTIADIPGLIEDAHLDRGLGHEFLRHVERAKILAFVIDLSAGDAIAALKALWREVGEFQSVKETEEIDLSQRRMTNDPFTRMPILNEPFDGISKDEVQNLPPITLPPITSKPWFVIATKADLPETQSNFLALQNYVNELVEGRLDHPSGKPNAHRAGACALPISAIRGEGVEGIVEVVLNLLK